MRASDFLLIASGLLSMTVAASATTHYVDLNNPAPVAPYTSWATAATNIQTAVDAAVAGDEIVVTNGTYAGGGRAVYGTMTNRVAIDKAVMVRSVNGPLVTIIEGRAAPPGATDGSGNGSGAVRCVYVGTNAVLSGFTLTNGHTQTCGDSDAEECGGGAWCEVSGVITNCTLSGNSARYYGGGVYNGTLNNCTLSGNSAYCGGGTYSGTLTNCALNGNSANWAGGGTYAGTLTNCALSGNSATYGGGVYDGTLTNCTLNGNSAENGGGAHSSTLNNCTLSGNSTWYGGGASRATLNNCTLTGNSAHYEGGGAFYGTLTNCTLIGNSATTGAGAYSGTLNNCTLIGNSATTGAGAYSGTLNNCIVYYNIAANGANYYGSSQFSYCCTVPLPPGPGNIDSEPLLASTSHLSEQSPCIGRGSSAYSSGLDIDGERWLDPPCIGADQFVRGQATGALVLAIDATYTNIASGFAVSFVALNEGRISASVWDFGDGTVISNRAYASHAWATPGLYTVRLTGYNDSWPGGVSTTLQVRVGGQSVYYVNAASTTPVHPYTNWAGAAANIQDAIDAGTQIGRLVLVADGVYRTGGRAVYGIMTNRVVVTEGVEVRSVNGPLVTIIEGRAAPGASNGNGSGAVRCVYVGTNAVLSGFTLTNGHTQASGDIYKGRSGGGAWCEVSGVLNNCTLSGNSANSYGGGVYFGTLNNCTLSGNSASIDGGGARSSTLNNCTLSGNSANSYGGGAYSAMLNNCIVYYNSASDGQNYANSTLNYCCATPLPPGPGNIDCEPLLASASHLSEQSPCIGRGSSAYSSGPDIDGERWLDPPCIGADQFVRGQATGVLSLAINATYTHVAAGFPVSFVALNEGRVSASVWDFGDATVVSNRPFASHAWVTPGLYTVRLTGYNDSWPGRVSTTVQVQVAPREIHYVSAGNVTPVHPYTSWAGAAANIQDAIDAGTQPGRLVLVADGVYKTGGRALYGTMTNRVVVTDGVEVRSVNGPLVTIIEGRAVPGLMNGNGAIRCAHVGSNAVLSGFTLTNGHTRATADDYKERSGGGAWCEVSGVITNCTLRANSAGYQGGGVYSGTLNNCILSGNSSGSYGGGTYVSTLNNCTLSGNSASYGGGASGGTLNNCIVYYNIAPTGSNYYDSTLNYCCATPLPSGPGNIEGPPGFVDTNGWSNLRLQTNSPCINAGANSYVSTSTDLDGSPRIVGGTVDMGAYEFQSPASTISYAWLQQYGLSTDGRADLADSDVDGFNNWQEWAAGTNPTNSASALWMLAMPPAASTTNGITVGWTSVTNRTYCLERALVLSAAPGFGIVRSNISGLNNTTTFTDTNAAGPGPFFYRVRVED